MIFPAGDDELDLSKTALHGAVARPERGAVQAREVRPQQAPVVDGEAVVGTRSQLHLQPDVHQLVSGVVVQAGHGHSVTGRILDLHVISLKWREPPQT